MKNAKTYSILFLLFGMISSAMAQQNPVINKKIAAQFDIMLMDMKKINVTNPEEVKKAIPIPSRDQLFDATLPALNGGMTQVKAEIETKGKQFISLYAGNAHLIDNDLLALVAGIPEPISG